MQLTERVHLVGSGASGFGLTDDLDAHVYLVDGGDEAALIDAGGGRDPGALLAGVEAAGVSLDRLRHLVLTHGHADHAGGAAGLCERVEDLAVAASPGVRRWLEEADTAALSVGGGTRSPSLPEMDAFPACSVGTELVDGDEVEVGSLRLRVLATPGHADGHVCLLLDDGGTTVLFAGDLVFWGGRVSLLNTWDCRLDRYSGSLRRLDGLGVDALLPGHHLISLRDGQRHIDQANRWLDEGVIPPGIA